MSLKELDFRCGTKDLYPVCIRWLGNWRTRTRCFAFAARLLYRL